MTASSAIQSDVQRNSATLGLEYIAAQIDQRFGKEGAYQVNRPWGIRHLLLTLNVAGFTTATNQVNLASAADITGVSSVVAAYMKPICANNTPDHELQSSYF